MLKEAQPPRTEEQLPFDRVIFDAQWNKEKGERHIDNMQHFTGFYHGRYIREGVGQPNERKIEDHLKQASP